MWNIEGVFHNRLIELESELLAKEQAERGFEQLPPECSHLQEFIEHQVEMRLAGPAPKDWRGWLSYRHHKDSLVICRGRAFSEGGLFAKWRAGLDVPFGLDTITEYLRGFDVSPPQDLDHLMLNFGAGKTPRVFLWYGENLAAYKLIYMADVEADPHHELSEAVVEACTWILKRPKDQTLNDFLRELPADG